MADSVADRIHELARSSAAYLDSEEGRRDMAHRAREARRTDAVDMSAQAVEARIRELSSVSRLCRSLGRTRRGPR